jgi:hypothetical protein
MQATGEAKLRRLSGLAVDAPVENDLMCDPPHRRSRIYVECTDLERTRAKPRNHERMDGFSR